ncbi:two-partner secretion domain-containing protein [Thermocoleostomius sinensis]|uniref:Filamentous hemagglutinin N-terminal domain-containing protein n=1 Tax=Thermocoleostomius sinensis A174 TaxID=2016057 RepID=A0A9E8ZA36_9CYAN|nr:filamentous hemagglutinin N-terminal domain-containing protein [Thermocoleostomius sinensis]WAL59349.1 filamentous hemagglutinin N-terminal domain-containing protein [Thermocoleostomius sinensis A174]
MRIWGDRFIRLGFTGVLTVAGLVVWNWYSSAIAQSRPEADETLGTESSQVRDFNDAIDLIEGGATRDRNLFHSFREFNIGAGRRAYFIHQLGIDNIFSRVTGGNPSQIDGVLGTRLLENGAFVNSDANLFLINPNGIIFGAGARLDIGGSFAATTANGIQFGDRGFFSATNPEAPSQLLTVDPSAFFFNQLQTGSIVNQATILPGQTTGGLQVPQGESLLLVGGEVRLESGRMDAPGGRIGLASVATTGTVNLGEDFSLSIANNTARADMLFGTGAIVDVTAAGGGDIAIYARDVRLLGSSALLAGISAASDSETNIAGDILIDATGLVRLAEPISTSSPNRIANLVNLDGIGTGGDVVIRANSLELVGNSQIGALTGGRGDAGRVTVRVEDSVSLSGINSGLVSGVNQFAVGDGALIDIQARSLSLSDSAQIITSTIGQGNAGEIQIIVDDDISLSGGSLIRSDSVGQGNAGMIRLTAGDTITLTGVGTNGVASQIQSNIFPSLPSSSAASPRMGGDIRLRARNLIATAGGNISASTFSRGNAGNLTFEVDERLAFSGISTNGIVSGAFSNVENGGVGDSEGINIRAGSLSLSDGASIQTVVRQEQPGVAAGRGTAGDVVLRVDGDVRIDGNERSGPGFSFLSSIDSSLGGGASGSGGSIDIAAGSLLLLNGGSLNAATFGNGDAGSVRVDANTIRLEGLSTGGRSSAIFSSVEPGAVGDGGMIDITADTLTMRDGAELQTIVRQAGSIPGRTGEFPAGQGNAGDILLRVSGSTILDGTVNNRATQIISSLGTGTVGEGGSILITTGDLRLLNGADLSAGTSGRGNAGDVIIRANNIRLEGAVADPSAIFSTVEAGAEGDGGTIDIIANRLTMRNGTGILTTVRPASGSPAAGRGNAGDILIDVSGDIVLDGVTGFIPTQINSTLSTGARGRAGEIRIETGSLALTNGARLITSTSGSGNAGRITIDADSNINLSGFSETGFFSGIFSTIENGGVGNSDGIEITAGSLRLNRAATIQSLVRQTQGEFTAGEGRAGNITIRVDGDVRIDGTEQIVQGNPFIAQINSSLGAGASGRGGNIFLDAGSLSLLNGASITASTFGTGNAGRITIDVDDIVSLTGENIVNLNGNNFLQQSNIATLVASGAEGNAGRIRITARLLNLDDFSFISSSTGGRGNAGNISIRVDDTIQLEESSNIASGVGAGGRGRGGDITLRGRSLTLRDGSQVGAFLFREQFGTAGGRGRGGTITINATDFVEIAGVGRRQLPIVYFPRTDVTVLTRGFSSGLFTNSERGASGQAGDITVNTRDFRISGGGIVVASTFNDGDGGDIVINADRFTARNGGQIVTNTRSSGTAGSITLNVSDRVTITGSDPTLNRRRTQIREILSQPGQSDRASDILLGLGNRSGLFVNADENATGNAGEILIDTNNLTMRDSAIISAVATGRDAGNIDITANTVELRNNSDIRTNVTGEGDGGNITIDGNYVVALGDSDILAYSGGGSGGNITLPAFFGEGYVEPDRDPDASLSLNELNALDGNDRVDVNASGRVRSGTITTPDTSAIQNSLAELPNTAIDTDALLANSCVVRDQDQVGTFIITGPGGLPERPGDQAPSAYPTAPVRSIPDEPDEHHDHSWQPGDPIVEPQGAYQLADGRMVLSRECQ